MTDKYKLTYDVKTEAHPEGIKKEDIPEGMGGADALFFASIVHAENGASSTLFFSRDGRTGEAMTDEEVFKLWTLLAATLASSNTLGASKRALCDMTFETIRKALLAARVESN